METLPTSIESYLDDAGFSGSEMAILKKLLEEEALTLRELASKTGKSTGVLDQAVKKLIKKRILTKESFNGSPKYMLRSLRSILTWMEEDMQLKQEMMRRRHEDFESFINSLTVTKKRPEMEYFEGKEGMQKAYMELLERGNDIVQYGPTLWLAEEDPLRDFRVQYFRERRKRGIFSRVITHDTVLGRRFRSRDPFEFRKTILLDPDAYPLNFEKVIVGDTVACFQLEEERACFIRYPELADNERSFFERLWNKKIENETVSDDDTDPHTNTEPKEVLPIIDIQPIQVPLKTRLYSQLREFFLSRKSIAVMCVFGLLSALLTYGIYQYNVVVNTRRIQDKVLSIAATGALQFNPIDLDQLHVLQDIQKPEYAKVVYQLNQIRNQNNGIAYAYLMRPRNGYIWEFIADADSIDPYKVDDYNNDGVINNYDEYNYPGEQYDTLEAVPPAANALIAPVAFEPETDQWGTVIAGWAPIQDLNGKTVAILGIDRFASDVYSLTNRNFTPIYWFSSFLFIFILIRLFAFNRSLIIKECFNALRDRKFIAILISIIIPSIACTGFLYYLNVQSNIARIKEKVVSIAATASLQFNADELDTLKSDADIDNFNYQNIVRQLWNIRVQNDGVLYVYLIRPRSDDNKTFEFIADADAYGIDPFHRQDTNNDGVLNPSDDVGYPGRLYEINHIDLLVKHAYYSAVATPEPYTDQWGTVYTGYAPIRNSIGRLSGLLAVDIEVSKQYSVEFYVFIPILIGVIILLIYLLIRIWNFHSKKESK